MWKCKNCGEEIEDNFEICWNCSSNKDGIKTEMNNEFEQQKKLSKFQKDSDSEHPISGSLKIIGTIMKILGLFVGIFILIKLSQGGMFSEGEITPTGVIVSLIVIFYHYVSGMVCIGIAEILNLNYRKKV